MTQFNKASLKLLFETGDVPTQQNYSDLIDSYVNQLETGTQSIAGPIAPTELVTPRVSATNINVTGTVSASNIYSDNNIVTSRVSTSAIFATFIDVATVSAVSVYSFTGVFQGTGIVSATGTAQATAASLSFVINRGKGIVDGSTTGFAIPANRTGLVQYLFNEGASANLWPPTGGFINGLAANAPLPLAASAMVTIVHLTASAYAVK